MILSHFCRVILLFLGCFGWNVYGYDEKPTYEVMATNTLTGKKNALFICKKTDNIKIQKCHEFKTSIDLTNPIALAVFENKLFVANYGSPSHMGTSFLLRCDLPDMNTEQTNCDSILALASASHITGLAIVADTLLFIKSNTSRENVNFNVLIACHVPMMGRLSECGQQLPLFSLIPNPQPTYNTVMPITVTSDHFDISDDAGGTVFACTLPKENIEISCQTHTFMEMSKLYPAGFVNPTLFNPAQVNLK